MRLLLLAAAAALGDAACRPRPTTVSDAWLDSRAQENACNTLCEATCAPSPAPLPPCDGAGLLDSHGCWANSSDLTPQQLRNHVDGDADALLRDWKRVWLPRACRYVRHSGARLRSTCPRLRRPWWILILGDSGAGRGLYCHLYALLVAGTERTPRDAVFHDPLNPAERVGCGGLVPKSERLSYPHGTYEWNDTHILQFAASKESTSRVFGFEAPQGLRVSWAYTEGLVELQTLRAALRNALAEGAPDDVVVGSGIYDYTSQVWSDARNVFPEDDEMTRLNLRVAEQRRLGALALLGEVRNATGGRARFWVRNNHCQSRFPAVHADARVQPAVLAAGGGVLETLNFSVATWPDQTIDGFHYDLEPWANPAMWARPERAHVGELVAQAAQSALGRLCG